MNLRFYPVHGKGDQAHSHVRVEALHGLHQADGAFLHQIGQRQTIAGVTSGDAHHKAQV